MLPIFCFSIPVIQAEKFSPLAIIGGQGDMPYAALVNKNGHLKTVRGLPNMGLTYRVAINSCGLGLIGGTKEVRLNNV